MSKTRKYWKGLEELSNNPEFIQAQQNEFSEHVPVDQFLGEQSPDNSSTSRRDFLKFLGFSVTAASLAACESPVNKAIPYVVKPEEITPGEANWYATTYFDGADFANILVKTREGRPIKIEGNTLSTLTKGATNARVQASILSLYDSSRLTGPAKNGEAATWADVDKEIGAKLAEISAKGGAVRILTSTIISPSTKQVIADFASKHGNVKHITYDAVSYAGIIEANETIFGKAILPSYHFDKANVVVSIGADFLANWISPIEFSKQYSLKRKISKENPEMARHIQFESNLSLTGANADDRHQIKPSQHGAVIVNLYNAIAKMAGAATVSSGPLSCDAQINKAAAELWKNKGKALVVSGSNDVAVQIIVNSINTYLGSYGNTIDTENYSFLRQGNDKDFVALVADMKAGKVDALITYNTNPVYTAPAALNFEEAYKKVKLKISFADRKDETAALADYICPDHHYLESWNDANPQVAHFGLVQPTISPLFSMPSHEGTRAAQETLLKWSGNSTDYYSYIQKYWMERVFPMQGTYMMFSEFWNHSLHDGVVVVGTGKVQQTTDKVEEVKENAVAPEKTEEVVPQPKMSIAEAAQIIAKSGKGGAFELALYQKVAIGDGSQANNPWLQELPDPISKVTWDNYITMSPIDMKEKKYNLLERQDIEASIATVRVNNVSVSLPVYPQPGQTPGTIGIALGYGRTHAGKLSDKTGVIGANAFSFAQVVNGTIQYEALNVELVDTADKYKLAATQIHHTLMGRDLVKETTLDEYKKNPAAGNHKELLNTHSGKKVPTTVTLWDEHDRLGHFWGLTIDLNSCIGCGACVVGCTSENNVAVVGKDQVMKTREMHWLRIDRYYSSDMTEHVAEEKKVGAIDMYLEMENPAPLNPKVVFQPMMCQHCNHAPCETVCPVLATNHSSEGLNQMTYNRCIGTRYCANNCPFKVRRFNWFNYNGNSDWAGLNPTQDDLGRMVLNPDVVVRSRGVMEKCSMCVQRIQAGKLDAKKQGRKLRDGEFTTACAQACPTNAIVFGDINNSESAIAETRKDERNYFLLEEIGIHPSVSYLVKVRNSEESFAPAHHEGGHEEHQHEMHEIKEEKKS